MATDSTFTAEVERLDRQRNSSLAWFLGSFLVWTLGTIAAMFLLIGVLGLGMWVLAPLYVLPLALWLFFLVRYLLIQSRIRSQPRLAEALNDELVRAAWL
jgi:Flp pilus assembly protein TadB